MGELCAVAYKPQIVPPSYYDDLPMPHRSMHDQYAVRIGDCVFAVPPEKITVGSRSNASTVSNLREKTNIVTKSGYSNTEIRMKLWFNSIEDINGTIIPSPDGSDYRVDGLRSLVAQFKRCPFLPVENHYLNNMHGIWAVTMLSLAVTTVPGFPNCLQAEITMQEFNPEPYTGVHKSLYGDMFCWHLFRWYYQQQLNGGIGTQLELIKTPSFSGKYQFNVINDENIIENRLEKILDHLEPIELSDQLVISGISIGLRHSITHLQVQNSEQASPQLMGSPIAEILVDFTTSNEEDVMTLKEIVKHTEELARSFRNRVVSGFLRFDNELLQMFGIKHVMISLMTVDTIEGAPGLYSVRMALVDFEPLQRAQESLKSFSPLKGEGTQDDLIRVSNDSNFVLHAVRAEEMLGTLELYPDLALPGYLDVNNFIPILNNWLVGHKLAPIGITALHIPYKGSFVDPDFYMFYPDPQELLPIELEYDFLPEKTVTPKQAERITTKPENNDFANLYLSSISGLTEKQINSYIASKRRNPTHMTNTGAFFLKAEREVGINALFLVALAAHESGWGNASFGNNLFGWGAFNSNPQNATRHSRPTMEETIVAIARSIKKTYVDIGCVTPYLFQHSNFRAPYAQLNDGRPNPTWLKSIPRIMGSMARQFELKEFTKTSDQSQSNENLPNTNQEESMILTSHLPSKLANAGIIEYSNIGDANTVPRIQYTDDKLYERMCHDMVLYSKRGTMLRAYPSFVFLIVDQGQWMDGRRLWDNYYVYHSISEISIHKTRTNPVHTAYIQMSNVYANLTSRSQIVRSNADNWWEKWQEILIPTINDKMIKERNNLRENLSITAGARVHIRMGYGSTASTHPVQFNGRITEMSAGDDIVVACQSDGIEISNPIASWGENKTNSIFSFGNEPSNILRVIFTRRSSTMTSLFGENSEFGIENFGRIVKKDDGVVGFLQALFKQNVIEYDLVKNIYTANSKSGNDPRGWQSTFRNLGFDGEANIQFYFYGKSVWDVSQILSYAVPGYISYPHTHGFHTTFFYGRPHWTVKYNYLQIGEHALDPNSYREAIKPFQQTHILRSDHDIIYNSITASSENLQTNAKASYMMGGAIAGSPVVYADRTIHPEQQSTNLFDSTTIHDTIVPTIFLENAFAAIAGLKGGKHIATNMAVATVDQSFKSMYQGELLVIGDPAIKPHDSIALLDDYNDMSGAIEVREVVHSLSLETGFTSSITPDLMVVQRDDPQKHSLVAHVLQHSVVGGSILMTKTALYNVGVSVLSGANRRADIIAGKVPSVLRLKMSAAEKIKMTQAAAKATAKHLLKKAAASETAKGIAKKAMAKKVAASPIAQKAVTVAKLGLKGIGVFKVLLTLGVWVFIDNIITTIRDQFLHNNVINIYPLTYKGKPYVAGTTGAQHLIPGMQKDMPAHMGNTVETIYQIPINNSIQTIRKRITSPFGDIRLRTKPHIGVDFSGRRGEPIYATLAGQVTNIFTNLSGSAGIGVVISHPNKTISRYLHLDRHSVFLNKTVEAGEQIGTMGNTGIITDTDGTRRNPGVHLHFDIAIDGTYVDPIPLLSERIDPSLGPVVATNPLSLPNQSDPIGTNRP